MKIKIFIGRNMRWTDAMEKYKEEVKKEFDEDSFRYCSLSGQAEAKCVVQPEKSEA